MSDGAPMQAAETAQHWPRRRAPVRVTVLPHAAHVSAWVRETATDRAVTQMFNDFDMTNEETSK